MSSLYESLGEHEGIEGVVDDFYDRVLEDERVNGYFEDVDMARQRAHQTAFLTAAVGGPDSYDGDDMRTAHAHLDLSAAEFDIIAEHLTTALAENGVGEAEIDAVISEVAELKPAIIGE